MMYAEGVAEEYIREEVYPLMKPTFVAERWFFCIWKQIMQKRIFSGESFQWTFISLMKELFWLKKVFFVMDFARVLLEPGIYYVQISERGLMKRFIFGLSELV